MESIVNKRNRFKKTGLLIYALGFALACRVIVAIIANADQTRFVDPDSNDYIKLADHLAAGKGYTKGEEPEIFRAPGYPFFLAPFRRVFPDNFLPVVLVQIVLSVSTIFLLWRLAMLVGGGNIKTANIAVLFQALTLTSVVFSNKILSETLFTFLLIFFLLLLELALRSATSADDNEEVVAKEHRNSMIFAILAGCTAAAALMLRAILLPILPLFLIYILIRIITPRINAAPPADSRENAMRKSGDTRDDKKTSVSTQRRQKALSAMVFVLFFFDTHNYRIRIVAS